ncbi:thiamine pyrophosphate-dependent enzyme, partial [Candidatus Cyanaurora vandensis]
MTMDPEQARRWLWWMVQSRLADQAEESLVRQGRGQSFQMSAGGHEALCVLQDCLTADDWLYPHYRDRALLLARGVTQKELFATYFANADSSSGGRQMTAHFSALAQRVVSLSSPVGSSALHAVGTAAVLKKAAQGQVVLCLLGDATTQQGEVYEAIAQAANEQVPLVFCIEDNGYGISTSTKGKTFWSRGESQEFMGVPIHRVDALDPAGFFRQAEPCIAAARRGEPQILICALERLASHSSSDAQNVYRPAQEMLDLNQRDPLLRWQAVGLERGWWTQAEVTTIYAQAQAEIDQAIRATEPGPAPVVGDVEPSLFAPAPAVPAHLKARLTQRLQQAEELTLRQVLNETLGLLLDQEAGTFLFGQDIEDPKGDVFGLTRGLSTRFPGRVANSPLAEATILGTCVGRAIAGERPIAFLQFIDFVGPGLNQIFSEVATMHWRTQGQWQCPMIIMAPSGAYRAGLGPWHSQSNEAIFAHIPGLDVVMPSTPLEAGYLLLRAFVSRRPTLYLYPKALLNQRFPVQRLTERDWDQPGRIESPGREITLVGWGNTVALCQSAAAELGGRAEVVSLQRLSPLPMELLHTSVARTHRVVVVHEDNQTCGLGAEILVRLQELGLTFQGCRVTRPDTHLPFHAASQLQLLPSVEKILQAVQQLGITLPTAATTAPSLLSAAETIPITVPRIAPSDEAATLIAWHVEVGETVMEGQVLADLEGDKAIFELEAPQSGIIAQLLFKEGEAVAVETIVAYLQVDQAPPSSHPLSPP